MTDDPSGPHGLATEIPKDTEGVDFAPGDGPLPSGAEDGFDPNVLLDPTTGKVIYKTDSEKTATKRQTTGIPGVLRIYTDGSSLRNGTPLASAGVGVYFGPGDSRFVTFIPLKDPRSHPLSHSNDYHSSQQKCLRATQRWSSDEPAR